MAGVLLGSPTAGGINVTHPAVWVGWSGLLDVRRSGDRQQR